MIFSCQTKKIASPEILLFLLCGNAFCLSRERNKFFIDGCCGGGDRVPNNERRQHFKNDRSAKARFGTPVED